MIGWILFLVCLGVLASILGWWSLVGVTAFLLVGTFLLAGAL